MERSIEQEVCMMFASDGNVEKALIDSIVNSIKERKENACST